LSPLQEPPFSLPLLLPLQQEPPFPLPPEPLCLSLVALTIALAIIIALTWAQYSEPVECKG
jgi:hypothetical protein